ncbi:uroporphyrinogen-III synthase [Magnetococcales bacterium HHB-1]
MTAKNLPLKDKTILITRPLPEGQSTASALEKLGAKTLLAPALIIQPPSDPEPFHQAMQHLDQFDAIIITSINGARAFLKYDQPCNHPFFVIGKKSAQLLRAQGYHVILPNQPQASLALADTILKHPTAYQHFLFPQAEIGRPELRETLQKHQRKITVVPAYQAHAIKELPPQILTALTQNQIDAIPFFSGRTAQAFLDAVPDSLFSHIKKVLRVALSPITQEILQKQHLPAQVIAKKATEEAIINALIDHLNISS